MKNNKIALAIMAVLLLIGAGVYAMHASSHVQLLNAKAWDYNGIAGQEADPANYSVGDPNDPAHSSCGLFQTTICQISAEPNPADTTKPNLGGLDPMANKVEFSATLRADE